jgi:acyl carrier protein
MKAIDPADVERRVIDIVADTLSQPRENVQLHSSLIDDLGAESIDFIDVVFRLEAEFDMLIPTEELWAGSIDVKSDDPTALAAAIERLRAQVPDFRWDRFPNGVTKKDLPSLITVNTITAYLRKQLAAGGQ